jgi:hypothetical protein
VTNRGFVVFLCENRWEMDFYTKLPWFSGHHDSNEILNNNLGGGRLLAIAGDLSLFFFIKKKRCVIYSLENKHA